jgi:hypothetical protein
VHEPHPSEEHRLKAAAVALKISQKLFTFISSSAQTNKFMTTRAAKNTGKEGWRNGYRVHNYFVAINSTRNCSFGVLLIDDEEKKGKIQTFF